MGTAQEALTSELVRALPVVVPAAVAALVAWLRAVRQRQLARAAAAEAEAEGVRAGLHGEEKMRRAVRTVSERASVLTRMGEEKARELIESQLPAVRRDSERPPE